MKIRMRTRYASPTQQCEPGKTINLPEKEAKALIKSGNAERLLTPAQEKAKEADAKKAREKAADDAEKEATEAKAKVDAMIESIPKLSDDDLAALADHDSDEVVNAVEAETKKRAE